MRWDPYDTMWRIPKQTDVALTRATSARRFREPTDFILDGDWGEMPLDCVKTNDPKAPGWFVFLVSPMTPYGFFAAIRRRPRNLLAYDQIVEIREEKGDKTLAMYKVDVSRSPERISPEGDSVRLYARLTFGKPYKPRKVKND